MQNIKKIIIIELIIACAFGMYLTKTRTVIITNGGSMVAEKSKAGKQAGSHLGEELEKSASSGGVELRTENKSKLETENKLSTGNKINAIIYAYNSEVGQTDSTPDTTASGQKVRAGIIANNCLKFETLIKIDSKIYEVQDRMNSKYGCEVFDIWMENKTDALNWGRRNKVIEIIIN